MILSLNRAAMAIYLVFLLVACKGSSSSLGDSFYEPLVGVPPAGGSVAGLWLVSSAHPSAAPIQITEDGVDVNNDNSGATFYDWTYSPGTRERDGLTPRFFVYGSHGHLFGISLSQPGSPQQLSNGAYTLLCDMEAVQAGPFSTRASFVVAQVSLTNGATVCDTTWIVPTDAGAGAAPVTTTGLLTFLGGLKDTSTGMVKGFLIADGSEVDLYSPSGMTKMSILVPRLSGDGRAAMVAASSMGDTQTVVVESPTDGSVPVQDQVYLVNNHGATLVDTYTSPGTAACTSPSEARIAGAIFGSSLVYAVRDSSGGAGYTVFSVPLSGGKPDAVYTSTGCEEELFHGVAGRLVVQQFDQSTHLEEIISLDPAGPSTQTPVVLSSLTSPNGNSVTALTDGDVWIEEFSDDNLGDILSVTVSVVDASDGRVLKTYPDSLVLGRLRSKNYNSDGVVGDDSVLVYGITLGSTGFRVNNIAVVDTGSLASSTLAVTGSPPAFTIEGQVPLAVGGFFGNGYALSTASGSEPQLLKLNVAGFIPALGLSAY